MLSLLVAALACVATATGYGPYANYTEPVIDVLDKTLHLMANDRNVTENCRSSTSLLVKDAGNGAIWALRFIDASGKPSSGLMENGVVMPGFFTECIETVTGNSESGKYCLMAITSPSSVDNQDGSEYNPWNIITDKNPKIGLCIPSTCTNEDVKYAMQTVVSDISNKTTVDMSNCYTKENRFSEDPAAITMTAIICLLLLLIFVSTVYDIMKEPKGPVGGYINKAVAEAPTDTIPVTTSSSEILCERKKSKPRSSRLKDVLLCFSFKTNGKKILHVEKAEGSIDALHGIRFLSMVWIICGHTISFAQMWLILRKSSKKPLSVDFVGQIIANGTLAVDTFLYLSGFLVAYVSLKSMKRNDGKMNIIVFYLHRYLRMTPLMMIIIGFCACILRYVNQGPQWLNGINMYDAWCKDNWWLNLLYVQNFFNTPRMCLSHTWYSAVDMQIYLISPIIIYALYKGRKYGLAVIALLMICTIAITAVLTAIYNYPAIPYTSDIVPLSHMNEYYSVIYIKPYCRLGPYLVGMLLGYFLYDWTEPINLSKYWVAIGWMTCIATNLFVIYAMWPANKGILPTVGEATAYSALARTVWAVTLAWVTFACVTGYGGFVNGFLSWRPIIPLSRLTYSAYLIHPVLMAIFYNSRETVFDVSIYLVLYFVIGNLFLSYVLSFFLSAMFESPIIRLEKILIRKT